MPDVLHCCLMDPFERYTRERAAVEDGVRAGRAVREVERRSRRVSMKARTPQRPAGSDLAWIKANNRGSMAKMGGQLNNSQADRNGNVAKAKAAGTFDRTRETYNTANAAKGYFMNDDGSIAEPGTAPKAPTPPEKPKGPPNAPQPPAPVQAKTPSAPTKPAAPVATAAPKTTPKMQEFFKSHAKESGRENQYYDDKGNAKGKAPAEAPKVAAPAAPTQPAKATPSIDETLANARSASNNLRRTNANWAEKNKPVAKAPEPERVKVDPNMVLKSPGEAEGRATPIETDAQKRAKLEQAAAQEADSKRPGYQKMRQAGGDVIAELASTANTEIPKAASAVAGGINAAGKAVTSKLASVGEAIRPFFTGDKTEGPAQKQLRELDKSQAARARGPSFTPLPAGTTPGGYKNEPEAARNEWRTSKAGREHIESLNAPTKKKPVVAAN